MCASSLCMYYEARKQLCCNANSDVWINRIRWSRLGVCRLFRWRCSLIKQVKKIACGAHFRPMWLKRWRKFDHEHKWSIGSRLEPPCCLFTSEELLWRFMKVWLITTQIPDCKGNTVSLGLVYSCCVNTLHHSLKSEGNFLTWLVDSTYRVSRNRSQPNREKKVGSLRPAVEEVWADRVQASWRYGNTLHFLQSSGERFFKAYRGAGELHPNMYVPCKLCVEPSQVSYPLLHAM